MLTCTFEDGGKASLRHIVVNLLIFKDKKILLVKRASHLLEGGKWGLVGGFMDRDENLEGTASRETTEETGYSIKNLKLFRIVDNPKRRNEDRQNVAFIYTADANEKISHGNSESTEIKWFDLNNLPKREEFAFDHFEQIELYLKYQKKPFALPIIE